jgi:ectoine hydroxylase-related dioxygenase (phytanoyl-CoA dioxygenase family)
LVTTAEVVGLELPRALSDGEAAHYREHGWVKLEGIVTAGTAASILARIVGRMGVRAEKQVRVQSGVHSVSEELRRKFSNYEDPSLDDPELFAWVRSREMARIHSKALGGVPVRWWRDEVLCKLPAGEGGGKTGWHDDQAHLPFDRVGKPQLWISLGDCPAEKGSMRFLDGSNWSPLLGRYAHRTDRDLLDDYPGLTERYPVSPPLDLRAGDATLHDANTIHYAPPNETDEPRWAYLVSLIRADICYNGTPQRLCDGLGLKVNEPFDHPRFPIIETS